jgi:tRNA pseudouridine38-40 synthase
MNVLLKLSYDGTNFSGSQRQKNARAVQNEIERALFSIYKIPVETVLASRTDAGVHAEGQRVSFCVPDIIIPARKFPAAVNKYLPDDLACVKAEISSLHPRYDAKRKLYEYKILNAKFPVPTLRNYTHFCAYDLDFEKMCEAAAYFPGTRDFAAFSNKSDKTDSVRTITRLELSKTENIITISIEGDGFLYKMIRVIAGTLIEVGRGKKEPAEIPEIILSKDRKRAGKTAGARGLTLIEIYY